MSPPPSKDWWLAAALTSAALPALGQPATRPDGVVTTVTKSGPQAGIRHVQIDGEKARGQRIVTDRNTAVHVLFADQSAITIAPNSDVVIRQYDFNDQTREGSIVVNLTKGLLRVVGGLVSKHTPTRVITPTATVGIRGGISGVEAGDDGYTYAGFLFGDEMTMSTNDFVQTSSVFRPGFGLAGNLAGVLDPSRDVFDRVVSDMLSQLQTDGLASVVPLGGLLDRADDGSLPGAMGPFLIFTPPDLGGLLGSPGPGNQS